MTYQHALDIISSYRHAKHQPYPDDVKEALRVAHRMRLSPYHLHQMLEGSCEQSIRTILGYAKSQKERLGPQQPRQDGYVKTLVHDDGAKPERCPKCGAASTAISQNLIPVCTDEESPAWIWTWQCHLCSYSPNKAQRILAVKEKP